MLLLVPQATSLGFGSGSYFLCVLRLRDNRFFLSDLSHPIKLALN